MIPGLEEGESSEQNSATSQIMDDQGEKDKEALLQDLFMILCRNGDRYSIEWFQDRSRVRAVSRSL